MKIVVGVSSIKTAFERITESTGEVFCGYIPQKWIDSYGYLISPNRRWGKNASFTSLEELKCVVDLAHKHNITVSMTLNAHNYIEKQESLIKEIIEDTISIGIDAFIVTDIALLLYIHKNHPGIPIHISTGGTVFNRDTVDFYRQFNIRRIIFPRSLLIEDAISISNNYPDLEFEVFMNNARCANIDGYCYFEHAFFYEANEQNGLINYSMCRMDYSVKLLSRKEIDNSTKELIRRNFIAAQKFNAYYKACGACQIFDISKSNIKYLKIPARASFNEKNRCDVFSEIQFIHEMISSVDHFSERKEYQEFAMEKFKSYFNTECNVRGINCYY